jgi:hypothetical protein
MLCRKTKKLQLLTEKFAQIRRYAVALEICLFLHQNFLFKIGKQQNYFYIIL